jgi:hypothetical protein
VTEVGNNVKQQWWGKPLVHWFPRIREREEQVFLLLTLVIGVLTADFTEQLADSERFDEGHFWKQRRAFEKKWRDPDDVYIDVERREEERKKLGLPSRVIGSILPHSAVAQAEERWEAEQERKKKHPGKHRK